MRNSQSDGEVVAIYAEAKSHKKNELFRAITTPIAISLTKTMFR
jgi:hypothetical protein